MRTPEKQKTSTTKTIPSNLTLLYNFSSETIPLNNPKLAKDFFTLLYQCWLHQDGWYVAFLTKKQNLKCWCFLEDYLEIKHVVRDVINSAIHIDATEIIVARLDNGAAARLERIDVDWLLQFLLQTKKSKVELNNYLIVGQKQFFSWEVDSLS